MIQDSDEIKLELSNQHTKVFFLRSLGLKDAILYTELIKLNLLLLLLLFIYFFIYLFILLFLPLLYFKIPIALLSEYVIKNYQFVVSRQYLKIFRHFYKISQLL